MLKCISSMSTMDSSKHIHALETWSPCTDVLLKILLSAITDDGICRTRVVKSVLLVASSASCCCLTVTHTMKN